MSSRNPVAAIMTKVNGKIQEYENILLDGCVYMLSTFRTVSARKSIRLYPETVSRRSFEESLRGHLEEVSFQSIV